jgi:hypothetical protein
MAEWKRSDENIGILRKITQECGGNQYVAADKIGCHISTIRRYASDIFVKGLRNPKHVKVTVKKRHVVTNRDVETMKRMVFREEKSRFEAAEAIGCSYETVLRYLNKPQNTSKPVVKEKEYFDDRFRRSNAKERHWENQTARNSGLPDYMV